MLLQQSIEHMSIVCSHVPPICNLCNLFGSIGQCSHTMKNAVENALNIEKWVYITCTM